MKRKNNEIQHAYIVQYCTGHKRSIDRISSPPPKFKSCMNPCLKAHAILVQNDYSTWYFLTSQVEATGQEKRNVGEEHVEDQQTVPPGKTVDDDQQLFLWERK